jgi:hypothetical protein
MRPKTVYGDDFIISIGQRSDQVKLKGDLNQLKCLIKLYQKSILTLDYFQNYIFILKFAIIKTYYLC